MIIIDGNAIGFSATAGRLLFSGTMQTQGIFGFITRLIEIRQAYQGKIVVLWDNRSWRYDIYPEYKANRRAKIIEPTEEGGVPTEAVPDKNLQAQIDLKEEWCRQKPFVVRLLRTMGVAQMSASNMEADDLAARLIRLKPGEDHLLVTGDADWKQLVATNVRWFCPIKYKRGKDAKPTPSMITLDNFEEATNCRSPWDFVQIKALTGDKGDNIPGVGGIGPVNARYILDNHGSVQACFNDSMISDCSHWPARVLDFANDSDRRDAFAFNMLLMWLNHPKAPATQKPIIVKGAQIQSTFIDICGELAFGSFLKMPERVLAQFNPDKLDS